MATFAMSIQAAVHFAPVGNYSVFYREAGPVNAPTVLLLHGFPSSSHQYRYLIPLLATTFHVIAPDLPGFGFTQIPAYNSFPHTFQNIANVVQEFLDVLKIKEYAVYMFDYGAPTALRLALARPQSIKAIVSQNGNAYVEGMGGAFWDLIQKYWASNSTADREALLDLFTINATEQQYVDGTKDATAELPESWWLDWTLMQQPGNIDYQLDLFYDYRTNVAQYPKYQQYFRETQVPLLAVWGKNDAAFVPSGAEAFKRDLPLAQIHLVDAGHFAILSNLEEIAGYMIPFLKKALRPHKHGRN
ncbi:Alpha/Beta hydrolase protein [Xylogone sp. PMI_703]|nr:Alpha/Beta hydrolase protein [Xylogone sp. PMI_703]